MQFTEERAFARHLKQEELYRVYLLYGEEDFLKTQYSKKVISQAMSGGMADFNLHRFEGKSIKLDEVSDALETFPMLGGKSCVVLQDLDIEKLPAAELKKLKELLADPPETGVLLLLPTETGFLPKKGEKSKQIAKLAGDVGAVAEFARRSQNDLLRFVQGRAKETGSSFSRPAFQLLFEMCGGEMGMIASEADKLAAYCAGREVTEEDVRQCGCALLEGDAFQLGRAILDGSYDRAMELLSRLFDLRVEPVAVVGALSATFVDLYRAKLTQRSGRNINDLVREFGYRGREFRARNAMNNASRCSGGFLRNTIEALTSADRQLKSSRVDQQVVLERAITEIFVLRQQGGQPD